MSIMEAIKVLRQSIDCALAVNGERRNEAFAKVDEITYARCARSDKVLYKLKGKANDMYSIICDLGMRDSGLVTEECGDENI